MSEEQRKVGFAVTAENQTKPAFDEIKRDAADMASKVEESGKRAAKGVGAVGDGGDQAAKKLDASTRSIIGSIQRATAATEAGEKGTSKYFETLAKQRGIGGDVLEPYLAQMRKAEAAQALSVKSLGSMEMTAKQTTAALRQVPAQFTDIIVSLQGGQAPMTVFLQQGGQLKDVFGGAGAAAKALGGYVLGLVNPFTVLAAAAAGVALSYNQGSKENDAFVRSIVTTGNASGVTTSQLRDYARAIDGVVGTQAQAAEGLAAFVAAGVRGGDELRRYTQTAIEWEKATGQAVSKTAEQFSSLQKDPLSAVLKLNEGTNFLTTSVYEQIKALTEQGRSADASKVAMDALDAAMRDRGKAIADNLGYIERGWRGIKSAAAEAWDAMLNVGRASTIGDQLAKAQAELDARTAKAGVLGNDAAFERGNEKLRTRISHLKELIAQEGASAKAQEESARAVQARHKWDQAGEQFLSKQVQMERELAKAREEGKAAGASVAEIEERLAGIREKYKDKGAEKAARAHNAELERQRSLLAELAGLSSSFYKDWDTLSKMGLPIAELEKAQADLLAKQPAMIAGVKAEAEALKTRVKAYEDEVKAQQKLLDQRQNAASQVEDSLRKAREEEQAHAMAAASGITLAEAVAQIALARAEDNYQKALGAGADAETLLALQREIEARKGLIEVMQQRGVREANKKAADDAAKDWERTAQTISDTLADYIMSGGKDAAQYLKRLFATLVLQPTVQTLVGGILGTGPAAAASGSSNILGTASNLGSLGAFGGTVSAGLSYGATSLFANGLGTTLAAGGQMIGAGSIVSGISTIAGAMGPIALGVAALTSLISSLDDSGTPHAGGAGSYSAVGGQATGLAVLDQGLTFGVGERYYNSDAEKAAVGISQGIVQMLDSTAQSFGQQAGYFAATAFADDSSKDGAWGSLRIMRGDEKVLDWADTQTSKWAPKEFSDGEAGQKEYAAAIAASARDALKTALGDADWAKDMLDTLGDSVTLEGLGTVVAQINQAKAAFTSFGQYMPTFAGLAQSAVSAMVDAAGGVGPLSQGMATFVENFYSDAEKLAINTENVRKAMADLGFAMPATRDEYKALVQAQLALGEAGAKTVAVLLGVSGAFSSVTQSADDVAKAAAAAAQAQAEAVKQQRQDAYSALDKAVAAEKKQLQDQLTAARDVEKTIGSIFNTLHSNVQALYDTVDSTRGMQASQAQDFIAQALATARATGYLPDGDQLTEAIKAARGELDASNYGGNQAERDYAALVLAGQLSGMEEIAGKQLTDAKRTIQVLEGQSKQLDKTLDYWRQQIDIASGTYDATLSVSDAVNRLSALLGGGGKPGSSTPGGGGSSGYTAGGGVSQRVGYGADEALTSFDKFKAWYDGLRHNVDPKMLMGSGYQVPDWMRVMHMAGDGTDKELFGAYLNMKNNPQTARDYEQIMLTGRSSMPTDGSTLVRSDLSAMPKDVADYFSKDRNSLLSYEAMGIDPVLGYKLFTGGAEQFGISAKDTNFTAWLQSHKWTDGGVVANDNKQDTVNNWKGYNLSRWDTNTGTIVDLDGRIYTPDGQLIGTAGSALMQQIYGAAFVASSGQQYGDSTQSALYNQALSGGYTAQGYYTSIKQNLDQAIADGKSAQDIADAIRSTGASMSDVATAYGISVQQLEENLRAGGAVNIPKFAVGTNYVPQDMLAQIHEGEAIVPKAFNPWAGGSGSGNNRLEALIERLTAEVAELRAAAEDTAHNTGQSAAVLVSVKSGNTLTTAPAPTF